MSQQPPPDPAQRLNIDDASIRDSQVGQAGRDLTQIQGQVVNVTVYDRVDVAGLLGRQTSNRTKPLTQDEYRNRKVLLNKVKKFWIEGVLEKSLHIQAALELGLEARPDAVQRLFNGVDEFPEESTQPLPHSTSATAVFNQLGAGRTLLILGEPGSGKTITLLKLARDLIARTEEDLSQSIPVIFNLSSWVKEDQTIADWLVKELSKYQVSKTLGQVWVEEQQLLLLLDGLDEVNVEQREACAQALNQFMQTHGQTEIIICSRIRDYEALSTPLQLQAAIYIQPLTPEQVNQYLERAGEQLEAMKTLLQEDTALQELAKSPLLLSILSLAYQSISVEDLPNTGSVEERRRHLFNTYIERMLRRRGADQRYSMAHTIHYLTWLARQMASETVFLIERMQPAGLQTKTQAIAYQIGYRLIGGLVAGLIGGLMGGLIVGLISGLWSVVLISAWGRADVEPVETLRWSWQEARNGLISGLGVGLVLGLILGLTLAGLNLIKNGLILGLIYGLTSGLILELLAGLRGPEIETKATPNQGIWRSARNAVLIGLTGGLIGGLLGGLIGELMGLKRWLVYGLIYGLISGLIFGGGKACITHFTLRLILCWNNYIPWNYTRFLDYATERIFLQKVGGGYIFYHRLLREHFDSTGLDLQINSVRRSV